MSEEALTDEEVVARARLAVAEKMKPFTVREIVKEIIAVPRLRFGFSASVTSMVHRMVKTGYLRKLGRAPNGHGYGCLYERDQAAEAALTEKERAWREFRAGLEIKAMEGDD